MKYTPAIYLLIASLAINLVLIGIFGGLALNRPHPARHLSPLPNLSSTEPVTRAERRFTGNLLSRIYQDAAEERAIYNTARETLYNTLSADTLDVPLVQAQLETLRTAEDAIRAKMQKGMLTQLPELSARQRERLARQLLAGARANRRPSRRRQRRAAPR